MKINPAMSVDDLIDLLADRVAARLATVLATGTGEADQWLDTRDAAEHLDIHRDTVRRLAASGVMPSEQDGPGCKRFFRRSDLDAWRAAGGASKRLPSVRIVP